MSQEYCPEKGVSRRELGTYRIDEVVGEYPEVDSYMEDSEPDNCTNNSSAEL